MKRYVQHISGQGERWIVTDDYPNTWEVRSLQTDNLPALCLPKSEYRLCKPPGEWADVTREYLHRQDLSIRVQQIELAPGDRFRFIDHLHNGPAILIERKRACERSAYETQG